MSPHILKPNSPSRRWRMLRRKRPVYPVLAPGEQKDVEREECGRNVAIRTESNLKTGPRVTVRSFVFAREAHA